MFRVLLPSLLLFLLCGLSAHAQQPDPLAGDWSDDTLTLRLTPDGGQYAVVLELQGERYPGEAFYDGATLDGSFVSAGEEFFFQASLQGDQLRLETEDSTVYELSRVGAGAGQSRNPLVKAKQAAPQAQAAARADRARTAAGPFEVDLPQGWHAQPDPAGGVKLAPPGAGGGETYALTFAQGLTDPSAPQAVLMVAQMLGQLAAVAQRESTQIQAGGKALTRHSFSIPQAGSRLDAYMRPVEGGLVIALASGPAANLTPHDEALRRIAATAEYTGESAGASETASSGQNLSIRTDANAPPFQPGKTTDGNTQSNAWVARLNGKLLTQMSSYSSAGGGFNSKNRLLLYPNGRFEGAGSDLVSVDVGSSAASGGSFQAAGWWRVVTVNGISYLGLAVNGAPMEVYSQLDARGEQTFLDGTLTYVTVP